MEFYCGNALCKKSFSADLLTWPLTCPKCGIHLYPENLIEKNRSELMPEHACLLQMKQGTLQPYREDVPARFQQQKQDATVENLFSMVDSGDKKWIWRRISMVLIVCVFILVIIWLFFGR